MRAAGTLEPKRDSSAPSKSRRHQRRLVGQGRAVRPAHMQRVPLLTPVWWHGVVGSRGTERGIAHRQAEARGQSGWNGARAPSLPRLLGILHSLDANAMPHRSPAAQRSEDEQNDNFVQNRAQLPECSWQRAGALHHGKPLKAKRSMGPSARAGAPPCGRRASA